MAISDIEKVEAIFAGISAGDADRATEHLHEHFVQHNPLAQDGAAGLRRFIAQASRDSLQLSVVRTLQDGPFVVTQSRGKRSGKEVLFDVFRFEDNLVVEHWAFASEAAPPNASGHTQFDGPTKASHLGDTEANRELLRGYYETFHIRRDHTGSDRYFAGDLMIRHEPGVRDGVAEFLKDVEELMKHRTIDVIKLLLVEGDLGFIAAKGTHEGQPCVYVDLYRLQNKRIVEHWGFPEMVPPRESWLNQNGML